MRRCITVWLPIVLATPIMAQGGRVPSTQPAHTGPAREVHMDRQSPQSRPTSKPASRPAAGRNRLRFEKSPYLLQHADNPVDWYPWSDEAFETARRQDKPIFLSIGYSTCHWCHVMEHESFEDPEVARLMNETFVNIKVDREERPDIDNVYMTVCQMLTQRGGWPLTIIMTPDRKPFFAATYIPKESRFGRSGMLDLVPRIGELWRTRRDDIEASVGQVMDALAQTVTPTPAGATELDRKVLDTAFDQLAQRHDAVHGGFGTAPKFPTAHNYLFLLRYWKRTGRADALSIVTRSLEAMRRGGIWDHVGFGFHRYSTDREWLVPHFEKMLYDQAMLAMACIETWQATGDEAYAGTARDILTYVLRDMTDPKGGFYSAEDADSEGEEGRFYVWTHDQIRRALTAEEAEAFIRAYSVRPEGNWLEEATREPTGTNILHMGGNDASRTPPTDFDDPKTRELLESARQRLFEVREKRVHPGKDDKILADWNGLMIAAMAKAGRALGDARYIHAACKAADFILHHLRTPEGRLLHRWRDGQAAVAGNQDDYAFLAWGLLDLYEATFEPEYLRQAVRLTDEMIAHFWDDEHGGFYFTADDAEELLVRQKPIYDGAVPSGNSVAMGNLLRLARMTGHTAYEDRAAQISRAFSQEVRQVPMAYTQLLAAVDFAIGPAFEVVIAGDPGAADTQAMVAALRRRFIPNKVVLLRPAGVESPAIASLAPFVKDQKALDGRATAYVCRQFACEQPTTDVARMLEMLGETQP